MIEVKNVVKTFDGFAALNDATISVPTGAVYGLVGPNGAGKSTIIRHLTGIFRQDSGTVRLGGEDVWENAALKAKIAAIPDDWYYFNSAGIGDMMRFYKGFYPNFSTERYEKLREVFELDEKRPIRRFSKGMQKQAAFWLALSAMPDYLILDEPVDGLDPVMRRQVWSLMMGDVAERGTTVLVSSHNLRELEDVCDHVGILNHGKLLFEGSLQQLQKHSRGGILLRVLDAPKAAAVLQQQGVKAAAPADQPDTLQLPPLPDEALAALVCTLSESGVGIVGLTTQTKSLEDIFLSLTQTSGEVA